MERWAGRVALVTGASAGIGAAVAYQLQDHGLQVVAVARRVDIIEESVNKAREEAKARGRYQETKATPGKLYPKKCDLTKEQDTLGLFDWINNTVGGVDVLINNAALASDCGLTDAATTEAWKIQLDVNILALSICTREAVQGMRSRGVDDGHIIHIGSVSGHTVHSPSTAMYSATKFAVMALTEELGKNFLEHRSNMKVTVVSPSAVKTEFMSNFKNLNMEILYQLPFLKPEDVADSIVYALGTPPHVQVHEIIINSAGTFLKKTPIPIATVNQAGALPVKYKKISKRII